MRTVYGDHERFEQTYFSTFKGMYFTSDGARRDEDGYYWITGRVDDVLNVSGHRMGTAEIESALVAHDKIAEAAIVGIPHDIKGQAIYAYITLNDGEFPSAELHKEVKDWFVKKLALSQHQMCCTGQTHYLKLVQVRLCAEFYVRLLQAILAT